MSRDVIANLVAKMELESTQFQREMARVNKSTGDMRRQVRAANDAQGRFRVEMDRFRSTMQTVPGPLGQIGSGLDGIFSKISRIGPVALGTGAAIGGLTALYLKGSMIAADYEQSQLRIEQQLKSTGFAAGLTARQIEDFANDLARATMTGTQEVRRAAGVLMQYRNVQGETFKEAIRLAQDMSAVWGNDLTSNVQKIARALSEPEKNLSSLRRYSDAFNESMQENINSMIELGDTAGAQEIILASLRDTVGGAGEAEAGGLHGATDGLKQSWEEFLVTLGNTAPIQGATTMLDNLLQGMTGAMRDKYDIAFDDIQGEIEKAQQEYERSIERQEAFMRQVESRRNRGRRGPRLVDDDQPVRLNRRENEQRAAFEGERRNLQEHIARLQEIYDLELKDREAAAQAAIEQEQMRTQEAAQRKEAAEQKAAQEQLQRQMVASQALITQMDMQYADQEERIELSSQRRQAQIEQMYADEEALARMGFESVDQLRQHYMEKELADLEYQRMQLWDARERENQAEMERFEAQQMRERQQAEREMAERERRLAQVQGFYKTDLELMHEFYAEQEQVVRDYYESIGGITEEGEEMLAMIRRQKQLDQQNYHMQNAQLLLSSSSDLFDSLASMAANNQGKQSSLYKNMFAASKLFAMAQSKVSITQGIANAAALPFPANIPAMGAVISATAGLVNTIQGTQLRLSGARANGGPVGPNGWYLVGERGPELLRTGSGGGHVASNESLRSALQHGGQGGQKVDLNFNFTGLDNDSLLEMLLDNRGTIADMVQMALEDQGIRIN